MKYTTIFIILALVFIIIWVMCLNILDFRIQKKNTVQENLEYERYLNQEITGTELATLICKIVEENTKNNIQKDQKGHYISNNINSIKLDLKMTTIDKTYPMEEIYNNKISNFVQNFSSVKFKCTKIEYHNSSQKVSKLLFEELQ